MFAVKPWSGLVLIASLSALSCAWAETAQTVPKADSSAVMAQPLSPQSLSEQDKAFIEELEHRTFSWFWTYSNPKNGLIPDRAPWPEGTSSIASIASVGFGLTAYGIGAERGYITHQQAVERSLTSLRFLFSLPQGPAMDGTAGYHGFYYHFLNPQTGLRLSRDIELSSIDTALLMSGVLFAQSYYQADTPDEREIRELAEKIYRRVDWPWMQNKGKWLRMGWYPPDNFISAEWKGYNESLMLYLLALASPTSPLPPTLWQDWTQTYSQQWGDFYGHILLNFAPLFGHQYTESWIDFRGLQDDFSSKHKTDYSRNGREAVYAQQAYAQTNPQHWQGYSKVVWGLTASDGPGNIVQKDKGGTERHYLSYSARGAGRDYIQDDGTIAPTAAGGSLAFAPEIALPALKSMKARYGTRIYNRYGFVDAFNPTFLTKDGHYWADTQQVGIDQGPILLMTENWRSGFVWRIMSRNKHIRTGLIRAGFHGGWLTQKAK